MRQELHDIHLTGNPGDIQSQQPAGLDTGQLTPFDTDTKSSITGTESMMWFLS